ncbi:MAG: hypothetical protein ACTSSP_00265 [Candidatus Asgardarchaeia archaeon]
MKIRTGFVSNSSVSSFTIYGWTEKDLSEHLASLCSSFKNVDVSIDESFIESLDEIWEGNKWDLNSTYGPDGRMVFGLGTHDSEVDHSGYDYTGENFKFPEPSYKDQKKFDELAKKLKLPQPKMHQATWYD